jgi:hypothetical protein
MAACTLELAQSRIAVPIAALRRVLWKPPPPSSGAPRIKSKFLKQASRNENGGRISNRSDCMIAKNQNPLFPHVVGDKLLRLHPRRATITGNQQFCTKERDGACQARIWIPQHAMPSPTKQAAHGHSA